MQFRNIPFDWSRAWYNCEYCNRKVNHNAECECQKQLNDLVAGRDIFTLVTDFRKEHPELKVSFEINLKGLTV